MTTVFTDPPADKTSDVFPYNNPAQQWGKTDANAVFTSIRELQAYLEAGVMDAATTTTVSDLDLKLDTGPTVGPELDWAGYNGRWFVGVDVANSPTSRDFVLTGLRGTYSFPDGVTTSGSPTLTSASGGNFTSALIGSAISGSGIPPGTTISGVGGLTSLTMSANATATGSGVRVTITKNTASDLMYWKHRGGLSPTLGIGVTPPDGSARLQISPEDTEPTMGGIRLRVGPSQTANAMTVYDSAAADRFWITKDFYLSGNHPIGGALLVQADSGNARALVMADNAKSNFYGFTFPGGNATTFRCISGGNDSWTVGTNGSWRHISSQLGFFSAAATAKPTVTGSRGGNAALASLLTALSTLGLITDSSTA